MKMETNIKILDTNGGSELIWIKKEIPDQQYSENEIDEGTRDLCIKKEPSGFSKTDESEGMQTRRPGNEVAEIFLPLDVSGVEGLCSRNYICHHCKKSRRSVKSLRSHIKRKHIKASGRGKTGRQLQESVRRKRRVLQEKKLYPCPFCDYCPSQLFILRNHVLGVHTDTKPYKCTLCDYKTAYSRSLQVHIRGVHNKEKPYRCKECNYSTSHSSHLKTHVRGVHSQERPHHCLFCEYSTAYPRALRVHTMAHHTGERPFRCPECEYGAVQASDLRLHIINHHRTDEEKPHQCPYCPYRSAQISHIKTHIAAVHMKDPSYTCSLCPFSSTYAIALKRHMSMVHGENLKASNIGIHFNHTSDISNAFNANLQENLLFVDHVNQMYGQNYLSRFLNNSTGMEYDSDSSNRDSSEIEEPLGTHNIGNSESTLDNSNSNDDSTNPLIENPQHLEPIVDINPGNSGPEIMQVALNPFDYALPSSLEDQVSNVQLKKKRKRKRERDKSDQQEKQYPCPQCDYCFSKSKHLMFHMKAEHPGFKSFPCTQCDFTAPKSSLLKYHVQAVHKAAAGAPVHQCPKCPYCTGNAEKLRAHIRIKHNRIRPYKCPHCSYSSTQAGHIKIHVRAKHTDEKPYHCSYCGYQSAYASALKSHITKRHANN